MVTKKYDQLDLDAAIHTISVCVYGKDGNTSSMMWRTLVSYEKFRQDYYVIILHMYIVIKWGNMLREWDWVWGGSWGCCAGEFVIQTTKQNRAVGLQIRGGGSWLLWLGKSLGP